MRYKFALTVVAASLYMSGPEALAKSQNDEGIRFTCKPSQVAELERDMTAYVRSLGIAPTEIVERSSPSDGTLVFTLATEPSDTDTLHISERARYNIKPDYISMPNRYGSETIAAVVSKKEILLALLQHGRLTEFHRKGCSIQALQDHIGVRQNTVAWASNLNWEWPDGESAEWNAKYWRRGTPVPGYPLHEAIRDAFLNQGAYSIGCYTATKLVVVQGVLDYYVRVKKDRVAAADIERRLMADGEPLVDVEPPAMWHFEDDFDEAEMSKPGKLLAIQYGVAKNNFVPGDWIYLLNTDPVSYAKTGYEGSNAIYLGGGKFDDYYNDNGHSYTYDEKVDEVYQWRHGVFSRSRDSAKIRPLTAKGFARMQMTPIEGGLQWDHRVYPYTSR